MTRKHSPARPAPYPPPPPPSGPGPNLPTVLPPPDGVLARPGTPVGIGTRRKDSR